jgi:hypothetical protein
MINLLDWSGFLLSGVGSIGFLFIYSIVLSTVEVTDTFGKHLHVSSSIKDFWLKPPSRKKLALWLIGDGTVYCFRAAVLGFVLQLIYKKIFAK